MKRTGALFVVAVAWTMLLPLTSANAGVTSKHVTQSRDAVVAYWTPARMHSARPVAMQKPGALAGKPARAGTATEVPAPYTTYPTSTHGKVFFTMGSFNYVCSGTSITSGNQSVVWTAGHCVNEGPGAFATNWMFVPAYRDNVRPYGIFVATTLLTTTQWRNSGDFSYDFGAAVVSTSSTTGQKLNVAAGGRTLAFNGPRNQQYRAYGYPAATPFNGQRLWVCDSPWYMDDTSANPDTLGIQCNMTGGSSGGGWVTSTGTVASVVSYGYQSLKNVLFGPYQGNDAAALFNTAQSTTAP